MSTSAVVALGLGSILSFAAPAGAATSTGVPTPNPGAPGVIDIFNINDFHGRIDTNFTGDLGLSFACTLESSKATYGEGNSVFLSAGDNIGASPFTSSSQSDNPTIDYLNALGLAASATGNHEYDKGYDDLINRVEPRANFPYLAANVTVTATGAPAGDAYTILDINGLRVGVIGAVTQQTPSLTGPTSTGMLTFGDPVDAVNAVAAQLTDGNAANGEADVLIAEYHEGATEGSPEGVSIDDEIAAGGAFAKIVTETSPKVAAIFTGHTHKEYAWDAPMPDGNGTRPILQAASYASFLGHVQLTFDPTTHALLTYATQNIPVPSAPAADCPTTDPQYVAAAGVVNAAVAQAEVVGSQPVGSVTADITTAYIDGSRDDRLSESTLSNLIAQSMVEVLNAPGRTGADIGVMNPGGVRAEMLFNDGTNTTGQITYGEAAAVTPFANTLQTITLTGAQFKQVLEQQWQRDAAGVPITSGRPYLKLGLSENVTYTFDPDRPIDDRITSITVNGQPIDPDATYRIVGASFLIGGGDNFWQFKTAADGGATVTDSGLIDTESFINWVQANSPLSPDFAKHAVTIRDLPTTVQAGQSVAFTAQGFDLTSLGSPTNTSGKILLNGQEVGTFTINGTSIVTSTIPNVAGAGGSAAISFVVPASTAAGAATLQLVADQSPTTVTIPLTITAVAPPTTTPPTTTPPAATPTLTVQSPVTAGGTTPSTISGFPPNTLVTLTIDGVVVGQVTTDASGNFNGVLTVRPDILGSRTLVATAGDVTASATFVVISANAPTSVPVQAGGTGGAPGQSLANTGTDAAPQLALAGILMLTGAGLTLSVRRRSS